MTRLDNGIDLSKNTSDRGTFLIVLGLLIAGFFIGNFVSSMFIIGFLVLGGGSLDAMSDLNLLFSYVGKTNYMIAQAFYTLVFTFLTPWFYLKFFAKKSFGSLYTERKTPLVPLILISVATIGFMFVNTVLIEWNESWNFPEFMSGLESWMKETEALLAETTEKLIVFNHFGDFILAFVVIAILPGIGEEILFRGVLQNSLHKWSKNAHVAIWVSGFLFAAIHMQFYGLMPRMMLGVLFGYLYVWSGNLWYPIVAHIINNGLSLTLAYLYQLEILDFNPDETTTNSLLYGMIGLGVCIITLYQFREHYLKPKAAA